MKNVPKELVAGGMIILFLSLVLGSALGISAYEETYRQSLLSKYGLLVGELKRQTERDVDFGKPLHLIGGTAKMFDSVTAQDPNIADLYIAGIDGKILYSTDPAAVGQALAEGIPRGFPAPSGKEGDAEIVTTRLKRSTFVAAPVRYDAAVQVGGAYLRFEERIISDRILSLIRANARTILPIFLLSSLLLVLALRGLRAAEDRGALKLRSSVRNTAAIGAALLLAQGTFALLNNRFFERSYEELFEDNVEIVAGIVAQDLGRALDYGVDADRLKGAESLLERYRLRTREADGLYITAPDGRLLYAAAPGGTYSVLGASEPPDPAPRDRSGAGRTRSLGSAAAAPAFLTVEVNRSFIAGLLRDALLDILTILAVSLVLGFELAGMLSVFVRGAGGAAVTDRSDRSLHVIRMVSFVFFFAALIPLSFLPAYIETVLGTDSPALFGLSRESAIGLPITSYMLGVTLFIPLVGALSTRLSVRSLFFLSGGLFLAGTLATAFAPGMLALVAARFAAGMGYGGIVINGSNLSVASTTEENRSTGFGYWSAGFAAATICAISIGGVIVNRLGYRVGVLTAAGAAVLLLIFVAFFVEENPTRTREASRPALRLEDILVLFRNRSLLANLLFSSIPFSLAYVGTFQYILPLYMGSSGISAANIGRILTVYGLISLATPIVSRLADRTRNEKRIIIIGNLVTGLSLVIFAAAESFFALEGSYVLLVFVLLGMGFGGMMIDASEESFLTSAPEAARLGEAKLLGLYATVEKIASVVVPLLAGALVALLGYSGSLGVIGVITVAAAVFFAVMAANMRTGGGR